MTSAHPAPTAHPRVHFRWLRAILLLVLAVAIAMALSVDEAYGALQRLLDASAPWIQAHPVAGPFAFVLLSGLSAMLAFVSSAVLVPVAVYAWGRPTTVLLLWLGWWVGGACAYATGRWLGAPLIRTAGASRQLDALQHRISPAAGFREVVLVQLALPSEIPGYLCGILRVRARVYLIALAVAELPYSIGTVVLGEGIVQREGGWVVAIAVVGVAGGLAAAALLRRTFKH